MENRDFRISTAGLGSFHSITPMNTAAAARLVELRAALAARLPAGMLAPLMISGALVVEPSELSVALDFLNL